MYKKKNDGDIHEGLHVECTKTYVFGPSQAAAQLEASKAFSKDFMQQYDLPTASYRNFTNVKKAIDYVTCLDIDQNPHHRQVVEIGGGERSLVTHDTK